jgi:hypothetical protein
MNQSRVTTPWECPYDDELDAAFAAKMTAMLKQVVDDHVANPDRPEERHAILMADADSPWGRRLFARIDRRAPDLQSARPWSPGARRTLRAKVIFESFAFSLLVDPELLGLHAATRDGLDLLAGLALEPQVVWVIDAGLARLSLNQTALIRGKMRWDRTFILAGE